MFKFLKEKLKSAISKISEGVEKEGKVEETLVETKVQAKEEKEVQKKEPEKIIAESKEERGFFAKLKEKFSSKGEPVKDKIEFKPQEKKEGKKAEIKIEIQLENQKEKQVETPKKEIEKKHEIQIEKISKKSEIKHEIVPEHKKPEILSEYKPKDVKTDLVIEKRIDKKITHSAPIREKEVKEINAKEPETKKSFFSIIKEKIITTKIDEEQFENLFWDMEIALLENNVAVEVIEKIKSDLKTQLVEKPIKRNKVETTILETLKVSIDDLFQSNDFDLIDEIRNKSEKPYIIAFLGINGSGKTTSIAKLAAFLKNNNVSCVLAAADTFRAASIEQLSLHAERIGVKVIKHDYGSDPAAVAFDAIKHAKAKGIDAVLIDTAGRMHSNTNLVDEMKKIIRVSKPDLKIFVGESITGNDCVEQAKTFDDAVGIDGIILAKADIDEKGGAAISVSYVTKKPILFLGTGQEYKDIEPFNKERIIKNIGLS